MSAAATAAGYLYASGRMSRGMSSHQRDARIAALVEHYLEKGMDAAGARKLAEESIAQLDRRKAERR